MGKPSEIQIGLQRPYEDLLELDLQRQGLFLLRRFEDIGISMLS